jgi:hypothetical protein
MTFPVTNICCLGRNGVPSHRNSAHLRRYHISAMSHSVDKKCFQFFYSGPNPQRSRNHSQVDPSSTPPDSCTRSTLASKPCRNPQTLRQESIQSERQLIIMKSNPSTILPARFKTEGMFPRTHTPQITPPFKLCLRVLLSPKLHESVSISIYVFNPFPPCWFAGACP